MRIGQARLFCTRRLLRVGGIAAGGHEDMSPIDVFTVCSFIGVILCGVMALVVMDMRHKQPDARIRTRMRESFFGHVTREQSTVNVNSDLFTIDKTDNVFSGWLRPKLSRLRTVA